MTRVHWRSGGEEALVAAVGEHGDPKFRARTIARVRRGRDGWCVDRYLGLTWESTEMRAASLPAAQDLVERIAEDEGLLGG